MIRITVTIENYMQRVSKSAEKAKFANFRHASARIRKDAMASIKRAPKELRISGKSRKKVRIRRAKHKAAPAGQPPYTQRGAVRRAIVFAADKTGAVIGPRESIIGTSASAHELGGTYKGARYPERPFMGPALVKNAARFASDWAGSVRP